MKRMWIILGVLLACGALASPVEAAGKGWHLRAFAAGFDPSLDETVPSENPDEVQVKGLSDLGLVPASSTSSMTGSGSSSALLRRIRKSSSARRFPAMVFSCLPTP